VRVQAEKFRNPAISAQLERLQAGVQTPLSFVKQTGEQDNRSPQFVGNITGGNADGRGASLVRQRLPRPQLLLPRTRLGGAIQIQAGDRLAGDPALCNQLQQRLFDWNVENVFQFGSEITSLGLRDLFFRSGHQRTVTGEPDRVERPQAALIERDNLVESIEGTPVRVTGTVRKLLQLAEDGNIGLRAQ
jgi:hypothetical protein